MSPHSALWIPVFQLKVRLRKKRHQMRPKRTLKKKHTHQMRPKWTLQGHRYRYLVLCVTALSMSSVTSDCYARGHFKKCTKWPKMTWAQNQSYPINVLSLNPKFHTFRSMGNHFLVAGYLKTSGLVVDWTPNNLDNYKVKRYLTYVLLVFLAPKSFRRGSMLTKLGKEAINENFRKAHTNLCGDYNQRPGKA